MLIYDPTSPLAAGFWLSFGAVALILYGMAQRAGREPWWRQWNRLQWLIALGLLPVTLLLFQRASLIAPLVNLIAVPWIGLVVTPLALAGTLLWPEGLVGGALLDLAAWLIELLWPVLDRLAQWPLAQWQTGAPSLVTLLAASAGALLLLAPRGLPVRGAGLALFLPLLLPNSDAPAPGAFEFTLLDVGQGLATVVRTRSHVLVYDTGPRFSESFDAGKGILTPFLHGEGVRFIDRVIVSHGDLDHRGGAANLLGAWRVGSVWSSDPAALGRDDVTRCTNDLAWEWDGVRFEILHPAPDAHWEGNDGSCVLRIVGRGGSVLLAGDIERGAERHLLRTQAAKLRADLLVVPHHGSKTSSSPGFIAAVAPRYALIAAGDHNRYGHPHASVLARYRAFGVNVLDSVHGGAIGFRFAAGQAPVPHSHRQAARRYWHAR